MLIEANASEANLDAFLSLPDFLYRDDPDRIPEPSSKTQGSLLRDRFVGRQKALAWYDGQRAVARVVARVSPSLKDDHQAPIGMMGFFEALNAPDEATQVLSEAIHWLREHGVRRIVGPMDGDTWHRYRFNVGPFDRPPFLMEPYNKPYYGELWQNVGFRPLERYYSKVVDDVEAVAATLTKIHQRVLDHGYRLRPIDITRFEAEMEVIYQLSIKIFADNFMYEEISLDEFLALYRPARSLIDPRLVLIAESPDGEPVGFMFSLVDYHRAVAAMRGSTGLLAKLRFLLNRRHADAVNMKSIGILRGHRRSGLAGALMYHSYRTALEMGFRKANLCLIRDGNPSGELDGGLGVISRRYLLYEYAGEEI